MTKMLETESHSLLKSVLRGLVVPAILLGGLALCPGLLAQQPKLIPQPREVETTPASFKISADLEIALITPVNPDDRFAAASIQKELELSTGRRFPIVAATELPAHKPAIVLGRLDQPALQAQMKIQKMRVEGVGDQGYVLVVAPEQVLLAGKDAAGLFYGVQTLRQLVVPSGNGQAEILGARVRDWPALQYRGTQVDLSRGPVPNLHYLKRTVRTIAEFKMNQLYLYIEDSFRLDGQPLVGVLSDTLSHQDWKELVAYASRYHVDIVPATEACGHLHKILRFEQYTGMAERPHGHVLAPGDPNATGFLESLYAQMVPIFPSQIYHIGCDETFELGLGRSADLVQKEGYGKVYVDSLTRVYDLVRQYNKQVIFWGDIAVEHPEMIPSLPKGLIVASWEYGAHQSYAKWLKPFEGTGMKIIVCPWVGNTSLIVPDYEEAAANIRQFLSDGKKAGAIGADITVWNDDGESLYGPNWWSIVYGAACAWEQGDPGVQEFNRKFDWAFYRNTDHSLTDAIMALGHINEIIRAGGPVQTYDMHWGGADDAKFWHNPFSPLWQSDVQQMLPVASLVRKTSEDAYTVLVNNTDRAKRNADTLQDLEFAALKLDALGMRCQFAQEISERYTDAYTHQNDKTWRLTGNDLSDIDSTNGRLQDLRDYTTRLRELYKQFWLQENLPTWLPNVLQLYDRNSQLWQDLITKFTELHTGHSRGQPLPSPESLGLLPVEPAATKSVP